MQYRNARAFVLLFLLQFPESLLSEGTMKGFILLSILSLSICSSAFAKNLYPNWNKVLVKEGAWCKGKGVTVYDNGGRPFAEEPYDYCQHKGVMCETAKECKNGQGAKLGPMWQCIELPKRLYHMNGWYMGSFGAGTAAAMWGKDTQTLKSMRMEKHERQSDYAPVPGDMMFFTFGTSGHVAVVDYLDGYSIHICEQNYISSKGGTRVFERSKLPSDCLGWIHSLNNPLKNDIPAEPNSSDPATEDAKIYIKRSPSGKRLFDVYVRFSPTAAPIKFPSIRDVDHDSFHCAEYRGGNLYVRIRPGGEDSHNRSDWSDQLWRYAANGRGEKLYTSQGVDFCIKPDESRIALIDNSNRLTVIDESGRVKTTIDASPFLGEFGQLYLEGWNGDSLWIRDQEGMDILGLIEIDTVSKKTTRHDLAKLNLSDEDRAFRRDSQILAYSDYPVILEEDEYVRLKNKKTPVSLYVYDLGSRKKVFIAKSVFKRFDPKWVESDIVEYNNPEGTGRLRKSVSF